MIAKDVQAEISRGNLVMKVLQARYCEARDYGGRGDTPMAKHCRTTAHPPHVWHDFADGADCWCGGT